MSSEFFYVGNRKLIPLKSLDAKVPYSKDYVARLAREGKIAAAQINRQWYIDPVSLQNFYDHAQLELRARTDYVRSLRKQELDLHEWWNQFVATQTARRAGRTERVVGRSVIVIILGCLVGLFVTNFLPFTEPQFVARLITGGTQLAAPASAPTTLSLDTWYETGEVITQDETITASSGILLLPHMTASTAASTTSGVADLFSHPVSVTDTSSTTGLVTTPDGASVPFVRVPVETEGDNP